MSKYGRSRLAMRHRAVIQRDSGGGVDSLGDPTVSWATISTTPCRVLTNKAVPVLQEDRQRYLQIMQAILPVGTDVTRDDRVLKITDRASVKRYGRTDDDGTTDIPITIDGIHRQEDHLLLTLRTDEAGPVSA